MRNKSTSNNDGNVTSYTGFTTGLRINGIGYVHQPKWQNVCGLESHVHNSRIWGLQQSHMIEMRANNSSVPVLAEPDKHI